MTTTDDSSLWAAHWRDAETPCRGEGGLSEDEVCSCPDLAAICDAFDTDDSEPLPERGDFWEQPEEEDQ